MEKNWVNIYKTSNFFTAEMIRQMLIDNDIPAVILNKQDSSYRFGFIELFAHADHREKAQALIEQFQAGSTEKE